MAEPTFWMSMKYGCDQCSLELTFLLEEGCEGPKDEQRAPPDRMIAVYKPSGAPVPASIPFTRGGRFVLPVPMFAGSCPRCGKGMMGHVKWSEDEVFTKQVIGAPNAPHFRYPEDPYQHHACGHPVWAGLEGRFDDQAPLVDADPDWRCGTCEHEVNSAEMGRALVTSCPACGSSLPPVVIAHDVQITLAWLDLRCLVQWAENYITGTTETADLTRYWEALKGRIASVRPEGTDPLTLLEVVSELREDGHEVTLYQPRTPEARDGL